MTEATQHACMHWRRKWQPTPVFLPRESRGQRSLVGCRPWGRIESDTTEATQHACMHWRRKWQPPPIFLPGEFQEQRSLVGCHLWGHTESDMTEVTQQQQQQQQEGDQILDVISDNQDNVSFIIQDASKSLKGLSQHSHAEFLTNFCKFFQITIIFNFFFVLSYWEGRRSSDFLYHAF